MGRARGLTLFVFLLLPTSLLAQAWVPPKGELVFSVHYQWLKADEHLFSNDLVGAELTPFEVLKGVDFDSTAVDLGRVQSQVIVMDADIGITEKLALSGGLAFVQAKWTQSGIGTAEGPTDDGSFHGHLQDARIGARYMALNGLWMLTPSATFVVPLTDYPTTGHAVIGRGLKELQIGMNFGRLLNLGGIPRAYIQGNYAYTIMEDPQIVSVDRSNLLLELGYFHRAMTFQVFGSWEKIHGGIDWAQEIGPRHDLTEIVANHDQAAATRDFQMGAAVSFQVNEAADLFVALNNTFWGANTHSGRTISFGVNYAFQAFGGIRPPSHGGDENP